MTAKIFGNANKLNFSEELKMGNNNKYALSISVSGWVHGSGWSYSTGFDSRELDADDAGDNKLVEEVKNGTFSTVDWDDFLHFDDWGKEDLKASAYAEEEDALWEMEIFDIDDYRDGNLGNPVYKCSAWDSDLAREWLEGLED